MTDDTRSPIRGHAFVDTLAEYQTQFLEGLGIWQRGYSPPGCVGKGSIVYSNADLRDRLALAGIQGPVLRSYFEGTVSLTVRSMYLIAQAAMGTWDNRTPVISMRNQILPL